MVNVLIFGSVFMIVDILVVDIVENVVVKVLVLVVFGVKIEMLVNLVVGWLFCGLKMCEICFVEILMNWW